MLTYGIPPASATATVYLYRQPPSGQSRVYRVTQLHTDGVDYQESAGTGPVVLKVVPVTGATFSGVTTDQLLSSPLFPHLLLVQYTGHQPRMVVTPARCQLNRDIESFPVPVRAQEFSLARQVRPSRPASVRSISTPINRLNLVLSTHGLLAFLSAAFRDGVHLHRHPSPAIIEGQSRAYRIMQSRTNGVRRRGPGQ